MAEFLRYLNNKKITIVDSFTAAVAETLRFEQQESVNWYWSEAKAFKNAQYNIR